MHTQCRQVVIASLLLACAACTPSDAPEAQPAPSPAPIEAPAATAASGFRCGDLLVGVAFDTTADTATLSWSGHRRVLPAVTAASGARYADADGAEFWNKGDEATLTLAGNTHTCTATEEVSPWDAARARGVVLRGLGTEPFWSVEVQGGGTPTLSAELDAGERQLDAIAVEAAADGSSFSGRTAEGTAVSLTLVEGDCSDGMSDQTYPASIELRIGEEVLRGCGARLDR